MALWTVAFLVAIAGAGAAVSAGSLTFPEVARSRSANRIVSGWEATEGQIPFQLSLRMVNHQGSIGACGGSIIHPEWGMTAAHCTALRTTIIIRAGAVSLTQPELIFETTQYYNHPLYIDALASIVQPHDIALLNFGRIIDFSARVQPVRLQRAEDKDRDYHDVRMVASGWGRTWTGGVAPENLQWVYLRGDANAFCAFVYGSIVQPSTICASAYNVSSQSTCQGDSGGPLTVVEDDGKVTMVGVTSFVSGTGCHTSFPAGFIRPGHYHEWYTQVTGVNFDWEPSPEEGPGNSEESSENGGESSENSGESSENKSGSSENKSGSSENKSGSSENKSGSSENKSGSSENKSGSSESKSGSSESSSSESNETDENRGTAAEEFVAEEKVFFVNAGKRM